MTNTVNKTADKAALKTVCIINPDSFTVAKKGSILRQALGDIAPCYEIRDFETLPETVRKIMAGEPQHIFIEGGDGTIQGVLSQILGQHPDSKALPVFTLLPGGMTNLVAKHVGVKHPNTGKIRAIYNNPDTAQSIALPALGLKPSNGPEEWYGFLLSTGAMPAATRLCLDKIHTHGIGGAAAVRTTLWRVLLGHGEERNHILKPRPLSLQLNKNAFDNKHIMTIATTLPGLMIGINPFWHTGGGPLKLTWVKEGAKRHVRNILRLLLRPHAKRTPVILEKHGYQSWSGEAARIKTDSDIVLDGEFLPLRNIAFSLFATQPLRFIR